MKPTNQSQLDRYHIYLACLLAYYYFICWGHKNPYFFLFCGNLIGVESRPSSLLIDESRVTHCLAAYFRKLSGCTMKASAPTRIDLAGGWTDVPFVREQVRGRSCWLSDCFSSLSRVAHKYQRSPWRKIYKLDACWRRSRYHRCRQRRYDYSYW